MWIHVPDSLSARESGGLTSDLPLRCPDTGQSLLLRSKPLQSRSWSRVKKTNLWLSSLSGLTSKPSMGDRGPDWLTSYLEAIRANRSARQASVEGQTIPDTSGRTYRESFLRPDLSGASLRTSQDISLLDTTMSSNLTLKALGTASRKAYSRRRKSVHPTDESGYSSWPTSQARDSKGPAGAGFMERGGNQNLPSTVQNWPTPDTAPEAPNQNSHKWASKDDPGFTPPGLGNTAKAWQTPSSVLHERRRQVGQTERAELLLPGQSKAWSTPTSRDHKDDGLTDASPTNGLLGRQVQRTPLSGPESSPSGQISPRLNVKFVEWLMNFPDGWTSLAPIG